MKTKSNHNTKARVIVGFSVAIILVVASIFLLFIIGKSNQLIGTFECKNEDGSTAVIKINKDSIYLENIDYNYCERFTGTMIYSDEKSGKDEIESDNFHSAERKQQENEKRKAEIINSLNFEDVFDKKTSVITYSEYLKPEKKYVYKVCETPVEKYGIYICVDLKKKQCYLYPSGNMKYDYKG